MINQDLFYKQYERLEDLAHRELGDKSLQNPGLNSYLREGEQYKFVLFEDSRKLIESSGLETKDIGSGKIIKLMADIFNHPKNNIVSWQFRDTIKKGLQELDKEEFEKLIFELYFTDKNEGEIFTDLTNITRQYDVLSYIFFLKDLNRFVPNKASYFDNAFKLIGIEDFKTSFNCNWVNYKQFLAIINDVKELLEEISSRDVSLLDAHTFLWKINEKQSEFDTIDKVEHQENEDRYYQVKARGKGQPLFKIRLMEKWSEKCAVTGISYEMLLEAAHIKPYSECEIHEEFDIQNGLILAFHIHKLFDKKLISFDEDGTILISSKLKDEDRKRLGISPEMKIQNLSSGNKKYLTYHRMGFKV